MFAFLMTILMVLFANLGLILEELSHGIFRVLHDAGHTGCHITPSTVACTTLATNHFNCRGCVYVIPVGEKVNVTLLNVFGLAAYFLMEFMNSRCFLSSSNWALVCSLA